ncbi:MAG: hypothetical protein IJV88_01235 [Ruminococcus sp.]|nr:hypothetical protein [Ruminococcus sp.]
MKKRIPISIVIAIALLAAAIAFSAAYIIATSSMNAKLTDVNEKQEMFSTLADVDSFVREKYNGEIDEEKLSQQLCEGYAEAFDGQVIYLTADEVKDSEYTEENGYQVLPLPDGSAVVISAEASNSAE